MVCKVADTLRHTGDLIFRTSGISFVSPVSGTKFYNSLCADKSGGDFVGLGGAVFLVEVTGREDKVFSGWFVVCGYIVEGV